MATIKSYTDLEQSKKLAEILPFESADMYYNLGESQLPNVIYGNYNDFKCYLPCWSLAALLKLIPNFNMFKRTIECKIETTNHSIDKACDLVDAAFEMVCWYITDNAYVYKE